ncbi:MAG: hypothetical protein FWD49_06940 [Firmicutes bacterium]|nr:hypothetical protein [Bacillota bacterium]
MKPTAGAISTAYPHKAKPTFLPMAERWVLCCYRVSSSCPALRYRLHGVMHISPLWGSIWN